MILLGALALIVIGPKQLPEVARTLGRFLNEIKRVTTDVTKTIIEARDTTDEELRRNTTTPFTPKEKPEEEAARAPVTPETSSTTSPPASPSTSQTEPKNE